ncbi:unnamed protein product, partial [Nesidiocoris tenuis]
MFGQLQWTGPPMAPLLPRPEPVSTIHTITATMDYYIRRHGLVIELDGIADLGVGCLPNRPITDSSQKRQSTTVITSSPSNFRWHSPVIVGFSTRIVVQTNYVSFLEPPNSRPASRKRTSSGKGPIWGPSGIWTSCTNPWASRGPTQSRRDPTVRLSPSPMFRPLTRDCTGAWPRRWTPRPTRCSRYSKTYRSILTLGNHAHV